MRSTNASVSQSFDMSPQDTVIFELTENNMHPNRKKIEVSATTSHLTYVGIKMPQPIVDYLDRVAARQLRSRSDLIRTIVVEALRDQGIVAPVEVDELADAA